MVAGCHRQLLRASGFWGLRTGPNPTDRAKLGSKRHLILIYREQRHHRFKRAMAQELMLRGSKDFVSVEDYQEFMKGLLARLNAGRKTRLAEEIAVMKELPERRLESCKRERVKVDSGSLIYTDRNVYSVPSRLIGEQVEARLYMERVEIWYGQKKVEEMPRLRGRSRHRVDYRHIIDWLVRKPGAFENYRYREELFPTSRFRMGFDELKDQFGARGSKEYLAILELAAKESEAEVDEALRVLLENGRQRPDDHRRNGKRGDGTESGGEKRGERGGGRSAVV